MTFPPCDVGSPTRITFGMVHSSSQHSFNEFVYKFIDDDFSHFALRYLAVVV